MIRFKGEGERGSGRDGERESLREIVHLLHLCVHKIPSIDTFLIRRYDCINEILVSRYFLYL